MAGIYTRLSDVALILVYRTLLTRDQLRTFEAHRLGELDQLCGSAGDQNSKRNKGSMHPEDSRMHDVVIQEGEDLQMGTESPVRLFIRVNGGDARPDLQTLRMKYHEYSQGSRQCKSDHRCAVKDR